MALSEAGFHRFADSIRLHLHETNIILLMYSVVDFANYGELKFWARLVEGINAKVIVLANKIDDRYSFQKRDQEISAGRVLCFSK
jgi:predicted GTPase